MLPRSWRQAATALPAFWLGLAALNIVLGIRSSTDLASSLDGTATRPHFLEITAALMLVGIVGLIQAATRDFISSQPSMRWLTTLPLLKAALSLWLLRPLWLHTRLVEVLLEAGALAVVGHTLAWTARRLHFGAVIDRVSRWMTTVPVAAPTGDASGWGRVLLAGALAALIPNVSTLLAGTAVAALGLAGLARERGLNGKSWTLPLMMVALLPAAWLLLTTTGSVAPSLASLPEAPLSPAAEGWIVPWLCIAAWGLAGLWPIQGLVPPAVLAPLAGLLLVRVGADALPLGMQGWQPLVAPLAVCSLWWAGAVGSEATGLAAVAMFGAFTAGQGNGSGAMFLFGLAGVLAVLPLVRWSLATPAWLPPRLGWLIPALVGWPLVVAGLRSQVVYTVLIAGGIAVAAAISAASAPSAAAAPSAIR